MWALAWRIRRSKSLRVLLGVVSNWHQQMSHARESIVITISDNTDTGYLVTVMAIPRFRPAANKLTLKQSLRRNHDVICLSCLSIPIQTGAMFIYFSLTESASCLILFAIS